MISSLHKRTWLFMLLFFASPLWAIQPYQPTLENPVLDPQNWRIFPELRGKGVQCLTEAPDSTVWFGLDEGAIHYDGINWTSYTSQDGIYGTTVSVLITSKSGQIYAGSDIGISRYNGQSWTRVFPPSGNIPWTIHDIIETQNGTLWAATAWGGLRISQTDTTLFTAPQIASTLQPHFPYLTIQIVPQNALAHHPWDTGIGLQITSGSHQHAVSEKSQGLIWAIAPNSPAEQAGLQIGDQITRINSRKGISQLLLNGPPETELTLEITPIETDTTRLLTLHRQELTGVFEDFRLLDVFEDQAGNIWFGLLEGEIVQYNPQQNKWQQFTTKDGLTLGALPRIMQTRDGTIWTLSDHPHGGINQFDGQKWSHFFLSKLGGPDVNTSLLETQDGTIWIGSLGLLWTYQNQQWRPLIIPSETQIPTQRARLYEKSDGSVWVVGMGQHAAQLKYKMPRKQKWQDIIYQCEDTNGHTWFLSKEGYAIAHQDSKWTAYTQQDGLIDSPTRLFLTTWGELWATGSHDSLSATAQFDGQKWHKKIHPNHSWGIDPRSVFETPDHTLWFGAEVNKIDQRGDKGGLLHYTPKKQNPPQNPWTHLTPPHAPEGAYGITQTADGTLWVCGWYGLRAFDGKTWALPSPEPLQNTPCDAVFTDKDNNLWAGTRRYGLFRYNGNTWTQYTTKQGLSGNNLNSIMQTQSGTLLIVTNRGLNSFEGSSWSTFAISENNINTANQSPDGAIWINYNSSTWNKRAKPDPKPAGPYEVFTICYQPDNIAPETQITIASSQVSSLGNTTFSWEGIDAWNATPANALQYAYRLNNDPWSDFATQQTKIFFSLPSGSHTFEVKTRDQDLNTDHTPAKFTFTVAYPIWQQPWFIGLFGLLISAIALQTFRVFKRGKILELVNASLEERVSERTRQLHESRNQLQMALNTANLGIWTLDIATQKIAGSGEAGLMVGIALEQPDIAVSDFLMRIHPDDRQRVEQAFTSLLHHTQSYQHIECCVLVDGEPRWIEVQAQTILDTNGNADHILGTVQDITTRRKTAQEMVKLDRLKALGEMAAGVSHNLNNILMGIIGPAQILQIRDLPEDQRLEVDTIYQSGLRARDLVKRLYQGLGDIQEDFEAVPMANIITEAVQATRPRWKDESEAKGINIQMTTEIAPDLPSIRGTKTGLHDILVNLIFNAVDAMPQGGHITIRVQNTQHQVCLSVSDTGQGMDEKTRERIFEPFFTTKMNVGTGLGLATVYGTVTRWQGDIQVSSQPNRGTTFKLYFQPWKKQVQERGQAAIQQTIPRARILILDDDETVRDTVSRFLTENHDITLFASAREALKTFTPNQYDIALVDLGLPQTPGDVVCQKLKEQDPNIFTILMTGWQINPADPRRKHADHYLQKPFTDIQEINTVIADGIAQKNKKSERT